MIVVSLKWWSYTSLQKADWLKENRELQRNENTKGARFNVLHVLLTFDDPMVCTNNFGLHFEQCMACQKSPLKIQVNWFFVVSFIIPEFREWVLIFTSEISVLLLLSRVCFSHISTCVSNPDHSHSLQFRLSVLNPANHLLKPTGPQISPSVTWICLFWLRLIHIKVICSTFYIILHCLWSSRNARVPLILGFVYITLYLSQVKPHVK